METSTSTLLYLSADEKSLQDELGQVVTTQLLILKRVPQGRWKKIFLRYQIGNGIYSGYTVQNPPRKLNSSLTKLFYLDQGLNRKLRVCQKCHERFELSSNASHGTTTCPTCKVRYSAERQVLKQANQRYCQTEGCGRVLNPNNKTGLCRRCFKQQGDFRAISYEFNPFYGRRVKRVLQECQDKIDATSDKNSD